MRMQCNMDVAPKALLEVVRCNCKMGCDTLRYSCRKAGLECSTGCGECRGICANMYENTTEIKKGSSYIAQYPVRWTAQSALHLLPSLTDLFIPTPFSASPGSILAMQQLRAMTKSLTFPPLSIARYPFIQLSRQGRQWREGKCPIFQTVEKGDSNPGSLDCESGIPPLSYRAPHKGTRSQRTTSMRKTHKLSYDLK